MPALTYPTKPMLRTIAQARLTAASSVPYTGFGTMADKITITRCKHIFEHNRELSALILFTRDEGMHASGWWKNPDYERCEHLSLSFWDAQHKLPIQHDHKLARVWCAGLWGDNVRYLWIEPPYSAPGKTSDVYHYRLFLAPDWRLPILPRKEVYTKHFTELGWKSWSDIHAPGEILDDTPP